MLDSGLQFIRPLWLLALLPWLVAVMFAFRQRANASAWDGVIDPALRPYVIEPGDSAFNWGKLLTLLAWLLSVLLLAGPVWEKQEMPVYKSQRAQVVLFDLSRSMVTDDIKPDRITRARFKLTDLLGQADGLQVALIAFAERPYVVSPLSDDANTIAAFVESLDPGIMPAQGSRIDLALEQGMKLLEQAGVERGQLVLFTDSEVSASDISMAARVKSEGHVLSVVGVGTTDGAPLRSDGRFLQDARGAIVVPQLDKKGLQTLANAAGGQYATLASGESDLALIARMQEQLSFSNDTDTEPATEEYWVEYAPYLSVVLLLMGLLLFRKGVVW